MTATSRFAEAVVFDCDGTLADTEMIADRAWTEVLRGHGYETTDEDRLAVVGRSSADTFAHFAGRITVPDTRALRHAIRHRFHELVEAELTLFDDAVGTLVTLARAGVPVAVASSSRHEHIQRVLRRAEVTDLVTTVVGSEDVTAHKPSPEAYELAAERLGLEPSRCAAVEDTEVGVRSATTAGMFTVAVVRGHVPRVQLAAADLIVDRLTLAHLPLAPR